MSAEPQWERVQRDRDRVTRRLPVPGGWLYQVHELDYGAVIGQHLVSVPKPLQPWCDGARELVRRGYLARQVADR